MLDLLTIALEAHSDERNRHRRYEVSVGRDLLSDWVVTVRYGRVGLPLRELRLGSPDIKVARAVVHERLSRRLSAPRRIGCEYRMRQFAVEAGCDATFWISQAVLGGLLGEASETEPSRNNRDVHS